MALVRNSVEFRYMSESAATIFKIEPSRCKISIDPCSIVSTIIRRTVTNETQPQLHDTVYGVPIYPYN